MYFLNQMEETFDLIVLVEINILKGKINFFYKWKNSNYHFKSAKFIYIFLLT